MPQKQYKFSDFLKTSRVDNEGKPLPNEISTYQRQTIFPYVIPQGWKVDGDPEKAIYTNMGSQIAKGYKSIFFDDYGIYLVVDQNQIIKKNIQQTTGNTDEKQTSNVETHILYRSLDGEMTLRYQIRPVGMNSFPPNYYYISVYDAAAGNPLPSIQTPTINEEYSLVCQAVSCRGFYTDSISPQISQKWPFIKEEYEQICKENDVLSLLGNYQVSLINDAGTIGIVNIFCNMAVDIKKRYSGMNKGAMVSALYKLCMEAPEFKVIIPYRMGCSTYEEWQDVSRMINCRLRGMNAVMVIPEKAKERDEQNQREKEKKPVIQDSENLMVRHNDVPKKQETPEKKITITSTPKIPEMKKMGEPKDGNRAGRIKAITAKIGMMDDETLIAMQKIVSLSKKELITFASEHAGHVGENASDTDKNTTDSDSGNSPKLMMRKETN